MRHVGLVRVAALAGAAALSVGLAVAVPRLTASAEQPAPAPAAVTATAEPVTACADPPVGAAVPGAPRLFLRIAAIPGGSRVPRHLDEIDLTGLSGGVGGCDAGRLVVTKALDRASVPLLRDAVTGHPEPRATIVGRTGGVDALRITLTGVRVRSVTDVVAGDGTSEQVTLGFTRIEWTYTAGRTVRACWDATAGAAC